MVTKDSIIKDALKISDDAAMKRLLVQMINGWRIRNESTNEDGESTKSERVSFTEACDGDELRGNLLSCFAYWDNDIISLAPFYGVAPIYDEQGAIIGVDENVLPVPALEGYYWDEGRWKSFDEDDTPEEVAS